MNFGSIFGNKTKVARNVYRSYLGVIDGDANYNTMALVFALIGAVGSYWRIWQHTIPAQTLVRYGYGSPALPDNQGYLWFAAGLAGTGFDQGVLRISQENYSGHNLLTVAEIPDSALHTATSTTLATATPIDRNAMIAFPEKTEFPWVGQDSRMVLFYKPSVLVAEDFVGFQIPVTVQQ